MNYAKATNKYMSQTVSRSPINVNVKKGWSILTLDRTIKKKPEPKPEIEDNEQPYYLNEYESYCFNSAIEDIYNRRLAESIKHYQETGEFDVFAQEAQRNVEYLAKYPDDEEDDYQEDYYYDE